MNPNPQLVDGVDVDAVAGAVRACPGVDDLIAGSLGASVVSYLPGRQLPGVSVHDDHVSVSVRAVWGTVLPQLAGQIRSRVVGLVAGRRVDVTIAELTDAPEWDKGDTDRDPVAIVQADVVPGRPTTQDEVSPWTTSNSATPAESSSAPTTLTSAVTRLPSSPD